MPLSGLPAAMSFFRLNLFFCLSFTVLWGLVSGFHLSAAVIYVKEDGPAEGEGTSWADAFYSVQDALFYSESGDEIWVAAGTYYPDYGDAVFEGDRAASFELASGVALYGGFAGTETQRDQRNPSANQSILSGAIGTMSDGSEDSIHVTTGSGADSTSILDGFTVQGGNADSESGEYSEGGGLYIVDGSPTIRNVLFKDNVATTGGAINVRGNSSPVFEDCRFQGNSAYYDGGAFNSENASPQLINCTFTGNFALDGVGGGLQVKGGGTLNATGCTFSNNESVYGGAGVEVSQAAPEFTNCIFSGNTVTSGGGGGMENDQGAPVLDGCTFSGNTSNYGGGGMVNWTGDAIVRNTSFSANQDNGDFGGGGVFNYTANPRFENCEFDGNYADYGGGVYTLDGSPVFLDCNFSGNGEGENEGQGGGGGIFNYDGSPVINGCTFSFNSAAFGAGVYNYFDSVVAANPLIVKCIFADNSSSATEGGGGGLLNWNAQPVILNCTFTGNAAYAGAALWNEADGVGGILANSLFAGNAATDSGGAIYNPQDTVNCTFYGNSAATGAAIYDEAGKTLANCILHGNTATTQGNPIEATSLTVKHSIVEGGHAGQSNLDLDPKFADAANSDFTLAADSPGIDVGDNASIPADSGDLDGDSDTTEALPVDLGNKVRTFRQVVDMGAYEFDQNRPPVITFGGGEETTAITLDEGQDSVATITAQDPDTGDVLTFTLLGGADVALFSISGADGRISFKTPADFENATDADANNIYEVNVTVTDNGEGSLSDTQVLQITVSNVNESPAITSNGGGATASVSVAENTTIAATLQAADPDGDTLEFHISSGADQSKFIIDANTGVLSFATSPDFESPADSGANNSYVVEVTVSDDGGLVAKQTLTVMVTDVAENQAPSITSHGGQSQVSISLSEGTTTVTMVTAQDADDDVLAFSLSGGADQALFAIGVVTGQLSFKLAPDHASPADVDKDNVYEVTVKAADGGLFDEQTFLVTITEPVTGDGDSDGLPDSWEAEHGLDRDKDDSGMDLDGDLLTNLQEYQLGTDPNDGNSGFLANELTSSGDGGFNIIWKSVSGKSYTIQTSSDFQSWSDLSGPHAATDVQTSVDVSVDAAQSLGFFRVVLRD